MELLLAVGSISAVFVLLLLLRRYGRTRTITTKAGDVTQTITETNALAWGPQDCGLVYQAHGIFWAGDEDSTWEAFSNSITAGLTAASCGIVYWSWDLASFSGPAPGAELYLRAAAAFTFMPIMQYHSEFNHHQRPLSDRTPWYVAESTGDDRVVPVCRRFADLREKLVGYLTERARSQSRTTDL